MANLRDPWLQRNFIIILPSSWYNSNTVEKDIKPSDDPSIDILNKLSIIGMNFIFADFIEV